MSAEQTSTLDLDRLLRLRLVVARVGDMDNARWWNTKEQLGRVGAITLRRGFPRTHGFARARAVFTVAAHRCAELFNPPRSVTLWKVPASLEDAFEARWSRWLEESEAWRPFFTQVAELKSTGLAETLEAWRPGGLGARGCGSCQREPTPSPALANVWCPPSP